METPSQTTTNFDCESTSYQPPPGDDAGKRKESSVSDTSEFGRKLSSSQGSRSGSVLSGGRSETVRPGSVVSGGRSETARPGSVVSRSRTETARPGSVLSGGRTETPRPGSVLSGGRADASRPGSTHAGNRFDRVRPDTRGSANVDRTARHLSKLSRTHSVGKAQGNQDFNNGPGETRPQPISSDSSTDRNRPATGKLDRTESEARLTRQDSVGGMNGMRLGSRNSEDKTNGLCDGERSENMQETHKSEAGGLHAGEQLDSRVETVVGTNDDDGNKRCLIEGQPSPAKDVQGEYGSPTRPKPPNSSFQKPSAHRMAELDRHVLSVPKQLHHYPLFRLIQYLTRPTHTQVETAYVIFRWVTCQDVEERPVKPEREPAGHDSDGNENEGGPARMVPVLATYTEQLFTGKIDHADMFSLLCKCTNLETHKVEGRRRFYCPQPSAQLCRTRSASWSAILLSGGWGFVDCALGARFWNADKRNQPSSDTTSRHQQQQKQQLQGEAGDASKYSNNNRVSGQEETNHNSKMPNEAEDRDNNTWRTTELVSTSAGHESDEGVNTNHEQSPENFYFLTPPTLLVTSHFPDNPDWQLLPHPVAETDFLTSLLKKPHLHYLNVDLVSPNSLKVSDIKEETDLAWRLKGKGLRRFAFRLFCVSDNRLADEDLTRYGFLENQHSRGQVTLRLIPPSTGRYVCELYGTYVPTRRGNEMVHMCSFDLDFIKTITTPLKFPHNDRVEWGPGGECLALGLQPLSHVTGCLNVERGEVELAFASYRPVLITQKLFLADSRCPGEDIPCSTLNFRDSKNIVKILLRIPEAGDYVLSMYAKDETSPGKCQLVCNYLVLCDSGTPKVIHPFPSVPYNKLGPTKAFFDFSMKLVCPKRSCIVVAPFSGKVTFVFTSLGSAELSCDLQHLGLDAGEVNDTGDYVQHTRQSGESVFRARLPQAGDYLFHLYGKSLDGEGHKFLLYSALIECAVPNKDCLPLPKVAPDWKGRVQILAPLRRCLVLGAVTHFAVRAYKVKAMAIVGHSGNQQFVLEDDEEENEVKDNITTENDISNEDQKDPKEHHSVNEKTKNFEKKEHRKKAEPETAYADEKEESKSSVSNGRTPTKTGKRKSSIESNRYSNTMNEKQPYDPPSTAQKSGNERAKYLHVNGSDDNGLVTEAEDDAVKEEEEEEDEEECDGEEDNGWQVWRCKVKVNREDEGAGVKLCVSVGTADNWPHDTTIINVAEFEVITERNMAAKLDHQHAMWTAAEDNFKVRPDSGHRSALDDEERQSAYFLDDEVYLSNPLGDENSDDDLSERNKDDDDDDDDDDLNDIMDELSDDADDEFTSDSNFEDTTSGSVPRTVGKPDRNKVAFADGQTSMKHQATKDSSTSQRKTDRAQVSTKKPTTTNFRKDKPKTERKQPFNATVVYGTPQTRAVKDTKNKKPSVSPRDKTGNRRRENKNSSTQQRAKEEKKDEEGDTRKQQKIEERKDTHSRRTKTESQKIAEGIETLVQKNEKRKKAETTDNSLQQRADAKERYLRRKMWSACQRRDREAIQKTVSRYNRSGFTPCADLAAAERLLHLYELRDALVSALDSKDMNTIRQALTEVERHGYAGEMSVVCRKAHAMLSPHREQNRLPVIVDADTRTLLEIRSYRCPPEVVHHVVVAALLLVGVHEGRTKTWKNSRRQMHVLGPQGVLKKMSKVKIEDIHPEISARARVLLEKHTLADAHIVGPGVVAIYKWARGIIARVDDLAEMENAYNDFDNDNEPPQPASKRRQREIFKQQLAKSTGSTDQDGSTLSSDVQTTSPGKQHGESDGPNSPRGKTTSVRTSRTHSKSHERKGQDSEGERSPRRAGHHTSRKDTSHRPGKDAPGKGEPSEKSSPKKSSKNIPPAKVIHVTAVNSSSPHSSKSGEPITQTNKPCNTQEETKGIRASANDGSSKSSLPQNAKKEATKKTSSVLTERDTRKTDSGRCSDQGISSASSEKTGPELPHRAARFAGRGDGGVGGVTSFNKKSDSEDGMRPPPQTPRKTSRRYDEPQEPLQSLSPHKSPLFRPATNRAAKSRSDARPKPPTPSNRPKTTPNPILQSTFFFASLIKDDALDKEENNNVPLTFKNYSNGAGPNKASRSASLHSRQPSRAGSRSGETNRNSAKDGRRSVLDITTPDI